MKDMMEIRSEIKKKYFEELMKKTGSYTIFISGGMSNVPDYRERFEKARQELLELGYTHIVNPVDIDDNLPFDMVLEEKFKRTSGAMMECDAVYFMPEYEKSKGAIREFNIALYCNKDIIIKEENSFKLFKQFNHKELDGKDCLGLIFIMTLN